MVSQFVKSCFCSREGNFGEVGVCGELCCLILVCVTLMVRLLFDNVDLFGCKGEDEEMWCLCWSCCWCSLMLWRWVSEDSEWRFSWEKEYKWKCLWYVDEKWCWRIWDGEVSEDDYIVVVNYFEDMMVVMIMLWDWVKCRRRWNRRFMLVF